MRFTSHDIELAGCFALDRRAVKTGFLPQHCGKSKYIGLDKLAIQSNKLNSQNDNSENEDKANNIRQYTEQSDNIQYNVNYSRWHRAATTFLKLIGE